MRKVSFPYMGTSYIPFERLLKDFGNKVIVPPRPTEETISYGTKYAPEFACYPFKIVLGTYIQVLEAGLIHWFLPAVWDLVGKGCIQLFRKRYCKSWDMNLR